MRILLGIESYYPNVSGVVIFTKRAATFLAEKGHAVRIITTSPWGSPYEEKDPAGFFIFRLRGWKNPFRKDLRISSWGNRNEVAKLIDDIKPDLVHLQDVGVLNRLILREAGRRGIPVIGHHHFSMEFVLGYFRSVKFLHPFIRPIIRASSRQFYSRCNLILTPTEYSRRTLLGWRVKTPVIAISNGTELKRFNPADTKTETEALKNLAERFDIPRDAPIVLYTGRMDKDKNIQTLMKAIPAILEKTAATFLFVGEGTDRKPLEAEVRRRAWGDRVKFLGFIPHEDPDLPRIYQIASLAWTASPIETQSITTLEAMAAGLPIVAANAGALPELVHESQNGFLVETYDAAGFSEAVVGLLSAPERMRAFGEESMRIASGHAIEKSLAQLEEIYIALAGHGAAK